MKSSPEKVICGHESNILFMAWPSPTIYILLFLSKDRNIPLCCSCLHQHLPLPLRLEESCLQCAEGDILGFCSCTYVVIEQKHDLASFITSYLLQICTDDLPDSLQATRYPLEKNDLKFSLRSYCKNSKR